MPIDIISAIIFVIYGIYLLAKKENKPIKEHDELIEFREESNKLQDELVISSTFKTPSIILSPNGELWIKGRSIPEDASGFYDKILDWIIDYCKYPDKKTSINIMLEYVNDGSMKYILQILRELSVFVDSGHELEINWYYESIDNHMKELGTFYSNILNTPINLIPVDKI